MKERYVISIFFTTIFCSLSFVYAKHALQMFQQQHYQTDRYSKWLFNKNNIHKSNVLVLFLINLVFFLLSKFEVVDSLVCLLVTMLLDIAFTIYVIRLEARRIYIKDLVITKRVKRQIIVYILLLILITFAFLWLTNWFYLACAFAVYAPYLIIYPMHLVTYPIEEAIKKTYENDAKKTLASMDHLVKIGITGSFGKTSTKNIINDIISNNYFTQMTPSSYNTPMGITRTIREMLRPIHEVFICEMGADKIYDISYLMDFVKPKYGVVTSIGPQHLATFHSIDNIINEKMREIEMLPQDGVGFINVDNEYIANYKIKNTCKIIRVGIDNENADLVANNIKYSNTGSTFTVKINGRNHKFETSLLGKHNIANILLGIGVALELNIPLAEIVKNVKNIKQIEHRLEVKKINGFTIIDDAFNSNPVGSKSALDVLSLMPGKRVIITPGMIDLGEKQNTINYEFGKYMINKADYVLLVGEKQTKPIYSGLKDAGFDMKNVVVYENIRQALHYAYSRFSVKDTILLENDLPDAFNV